MANQPDLSVLPERVQQWVRDAQRVVTASAQPPALSLRLLGLAGGLAIAVKALDTRSHDSNDYNCSYDPYADECEACQGADMRAEALRIIAEIGAKP